MYVQSVDTWFFFSTLPTDPAWAEPQEDDFSIGVFQIHETQPIICYQGPYRPPKAGEGM